MLFLETYSKRVLFFNDVQRLLFFQGSLVWFDANVGYLLPGKVLSIAGKDVRVQHELTGDVRKQLCFRKGETLHCTWFEMLHRPAVQ